MLANLIFFLATALLFTHELDAIHHHEWRIFPFLRALGEENAYRVFTLIHLPLFALFLWMAAYPNDWFLVVVDLFLIIHVFLHWIFRNHSQNAFRGWLSYSLIVGAGLMGAWHLLLIN